MGRAGWPRFRGSRRRQRCCCRATTARVALAGCRQRAAMGAGAVLLGITERLITMAGDYAKERTQFGKPIGSFQAVKHLLADALVRLEFARPAVYRAAWSLTVDDDDAPLHASMAKALASDAATAAARTALQVHGAIGYTWEHDLHLWMKPAWALAAAWGDSTAHRAAVLGDVGRPLNNEGVVVNASGSSSSTGAAALVERYLERLVAHDWPALEELLADGRGAGGSLRRHLCGPHRLRHVSVRSHADPARLRHGGAPRAECRRRREDGRGRAHRDGGGRRAPRCAPTKSWCSTSTTPDTSPTSACSSRRPDRRPT